jgi:RNA polymerase sigma factor (sigma-70 family)
MSPRYACDTGIRKVPGSPEPAILEKKEKAGQKQRLPLTPEQQTLAVKFLPLARNLAWRFKVAWTAHQDEFESAAYLALVEAAQSYDGSKHVKFQTYARIRIMGELRDVQRGLEIAGFEGDNENAPQIQQLDLDMEEHGRVLLTSEDRPVEEAVAARDTFERWMNALPKNHAAACRNLYVHGMSEARSAADLGLSKARIHGLHQESLELLNESFRWKNPTVHEDDRVRPPLAPRKKTIADADTRADTRLPDMSMLSWETSES